MPRSSSKCPSQVEHFLWFLPGPIFSVMDTKGIFHLQHFPLISWSARGIFLYTRSPFSLIPHLFLIYLLAKWIPNFPSSLFSLVLGCSFCSWFGRRSPFKLTPMSVWQASSLFLWLSRLVSITRCSRLVSSASALCSASLKGALTPFTRVWD